MMTGMIRKMSLSIYVNVAMGNMIFQNSLEINKKLSLWLYLVGFNVYLIIGLLHYQSYNILLDNHRYHKPFISVFSLSLALRSTRIIIYLHVRTPLSVVEAATHRTRLFCPMCPNACKFMYSTTQRHR